MQYANAKTIRSPYSGEYINPRMTTREDADYIYTEAVYICPSSGQFVQKLVVSTEPKKKVNNSEIVEEAGILPFLQGAAKLAGTQYVAGKMLSGINKAEDMVTSDDCDPDLDPNCPVQEADDDMVADDKVIDAEEGKDYISTLKDIRTRIEDIKSGTLLISRQTLLDAIMDIDEDLAAIIKSSDTHNSVADDK